MRSKITFKVLAALLLAVITTTARAQIVLHEATDVTQTKATLSADFPDLSAPHGFQYKYGTLPEIDEFSKLALSELSDPVQISTTGNAWSARTAKGWVESKSGLAAGQSSVMSATVNFSEPTEVTFEWSVDSEEGIGILSFIVDGEPVYEVSGAVDFTTVAYTVTEGEHTLEWQYKKTSATNVGLDLGMVRNIDLQNTTEGEWITKEISGSILQISNICPEQDYIFRAYQKNINNTNYTHINHFETSKVLLEDISVNPITQTTATIKFTQNIGDADVALKYVLGESEYIAAPFFKNDLPGVDYYIDDEWSKSGNTSGGSISIGASRSTSGHKASVTFELSQTSTITFQAYCEGGSFRFYIDDTQYYISVSGYTYKTFSYVLPAGKHTLRWHVSYTGLGGSYAVTAGIAGLDIPNTMPMDQSHYKENSFDMLSSDVFVSALKPRHHYCMKLYCLPEFESELEKKWEGFESDWVYFSTLNVFADTLSVVDIKQASATIRGKVDGGDATIIAAGLQYKDATGTRWTDYQKDVTETELSQNITRLRPSTTYHYRSYIQAQDCDTVFSEIGEFTTLAVEPLKPTIVRLAQHEAELQGIVRFGDASIYQRGMQFRKSGETEWEEVEDGGNDSIYTLVKKGLEMGAKYEARTYIQPAGCDIIYSDILEFTTLDYYFTGYLGSPRTQTTVEFSATVAELDEDVEAEYGFEYYLDSDGFFENAESFVKSDIVRIPVVPVDGQIKTTVTGLTPYYTLCFRAYIKIDGEYIYYTGSSTQTWSYAGTDRATINVTVKELTQTSVTLELDATQDGDAIVSQIEYAFANTVQDTGEYQVCGNELTINNLLPSRKYNLRFRGTVNGRLCPLLLDMDWDYSWFEFTTKDVTISAAFTNVTQTKATMNVTVNSGDAEVSDLKYYLNYGAHIDCGTTVNFSNLTPGTQYTVGFTGKINGTDYYWYTQPNSDKYYTFTTKSVSVYAYSSAISQTAATISWTPNYGDATYVSSGIECETTTEITETLSAEDNTVQLTELMPNTTYYYYAYVETAEGGKTYSSRYSFRTSAISCATLPVSNISNRSATMNGTIDCDSYSSAEFGFQWKQMEGWNSDPAFTKGVKNDDGSISVSLVNGMLEPNTDYQYRAAVRYQGNIYYASSWETFRTESEFVYYPASVYTVFRTDRENNCLVLCGYYVAGSETVTTQGYEYWSNTASYAANRAYAPASNVVTITTDESMQHNLDLKTLRDGNYSVRAFVTTSSGTTIYGQTLSFGVQGGNIADAIDNVESKDIRFSMANNTLSIYNATSLSCTIYSLQGTVVDHRNSMTEVEEFHLMPQTVYIVRLSNGMTRKIRM